MATEVKTGAKVETNIASSLKKKFATKARKNNTSMSQVLRDFIQSYVKK